MKAARSVLKLVAIALAAAAAACAVVVFWDKIVEGVGAVTNKVRAHRCADGCCLGDGDEDYTDWDE